MKRTTRKIAIILSIVMLLVVLTSCTKQVPSELAVGTTMTINDWQQLPADSGNNSNVTESSITNTLNMLKETVNKVSPDTTTEVDKEQIQQEIKESVGNIDENSSLNFNGKLSSSPEKSLQFVSKEVRNIMESSGPEFSEDAKMELQKLADRGGMNIEIDEIDNVVVSYVFQGKTYTTTCAVRFPEYDRLDSQNYIGGSPTATTEHTISFSAGQTIGLDHAATTTYSIDTGKEMIITAATSGGIDTDVVPIVISNFPQTGPQTEKDQILSQFTDPIKIRSGEGSNSQNSGVSLTIGNGTRKNLNTQGDGNITFGPGAVISQGHPEIVFGIGGLVVGFFTAMLIFRKKKNEPRKDENIFNDDEIE